MGILDSLGKLVLGMKDIEVSGNMNVGTLQKKFKEAFGTEIRVYKTLNTGKGSSLADSKNTLASIGNPDIKVSDISIKKSKTVGVIEDEFKEKMGIGIQIMTPDGKKFASNDMKLQDVAKL
tara:strand:- start:1575 stop:1937 length:363 start_codon:yes stop_codon:yes gene_type:complete